MHVCDGLAAQMDKIAAAYDGMNTDREVCNYRRNTDIPARRLTAQTIGEVGCNRNQSRILQSDPEPVKKMMRIALVEKTI
jgi:hypothetical protein